MVKMLPASLERRSIMVSTDLICDGLYLLCVAREKDFDVVLIDTAGRMQDNEVSVCYIDLYGVANDFVLFVYGIVAPHASTCKGKEIELFTLPSFLFDKIS